MKKTLSMLYQLQVLADELMSTNKKRHDLLELREQNYRDYNALSSLLDRQSADLNEALHLKSVIQRDMNGLSKEVEKIKERQMRVQSRIDYRQEVALDKQMSTYQNSLHVKFRELNQLLWRLGEPLRHPTYLKAHLNGFNELIELIDIEREFQLSFSGYNVSINLIEQGLSLDEYMTQLCTRGAKKIKAIGGVGRYNTFLKMNENDCRTLTEGGCDGLIAEDLKLIETKGLNSDEKRASRERVQRIQSAFVSASRSFQKLSVEDPRPKNYDELLRNCSSLSHLEIKETLEPLLPLSVDGDNGEYEEPLSEQFKLNAVINSRGFLHIFQEKYDRLSSLRLRMDKVEELQERELNTEESKVSLKLNVQEKLRDQLDARSLKLFEKIAEARGHSAVAYVSLSASDKESYCNGCKVVISKSLNQQVRRLENIQRCYSCQRILVPFAHITYVKEEIDSLLVTEEERIVMEERGELGLIPACSNCEEGLYADKETKREVLPTTDLKSYCPSCYSYLVPLDFKADTPTDDPPIEEEA